MRPSLVLVGLLGGGLAVLGLVAAAFPEGGLWWWLPAVLLVPAAVDFIAAVRAPAPTFFRRVTPLVTLGSPTTVSLVVSSSRPLARWLRVFDGVPPSFELVGLPLAVRPRGARTVELTYQATPRSRGAFAFGAPWIDAATPLGLWIRRHRPPVETSVRVFPDLAALGRDTLDLSAGTFGAGGHQVRRRGVGLEFHQLREYRQGDLARMVDGKASSRSGRLVVREMQEEQDQSVVFLVDTGYRMTDQDRGVTHFDRAFDAVLVLAGVALKQGDRVGVMTWGPDARWVPPVRGAFALTTLVEALYDLKAQPEASSPTAALRQLLPRLDRRTLVFLVTNFREEDGEDLAPLVPLVRGKHLLVTLWLREPFLDRWLKRKPATFDEALETSAAAAYEKARAEAKVRASALGVLTVDVTPERLRGALVGEYWRIKKRGLL